VSVPKQRNTKEENEAIKADKSPEGREQQPAKNAQKDRDARWTKKNDERFYDYKNHLGVDKVHKLIRKVRSRTGGVRVASCKGPRFAHQASKRSRSGAHIGTSAAPLAQLSHTSPKTGIVRGSLMYGMY
jgi:hypothetical protein